MDFKMTKELDNIFDTCSEASLPPKVTHLVTLAVHLTQGRREAANESFRLAQTADARLEELHMVACMCACTAGPVAHDAYLNVLSFARQAAPLNVMGLRYIGTGTLPTEAYSLDNDIFLSHNLCSDTSLDRKTTHLVGLAACLASSCSCAAGHIVEARNAGATPQELARCACIASCVAGLRVKYDFLAHLQSVEGCRACDCV